MDYGTLIGQIRGLLDDLACARLDTKQIECLGLSVSEWRNHLASCFSIEGERPNDWSGSTPSAFRLLAPPYTILHQDEASLAAEVRFGEHYLGRLGAVHGGAIALLFDEILGTLANANSPVLARTAYLHVDYRAIAAINDRLTVKAEIVSIQGRKRLVRASLDDPVGGACATAEGLFVALQVD